MRGRAAAVTAFGAATTWVAVPLLSLTLGRSLDAVARAQVRAAVPAPAAVVVPMRRSPAPRASVPSPRPAADDARRVSGVG
jgi:hypothetical protein